MVTQFLFSGEKIRTYRENLKFTRQQFAYYIGVATSTLAGWENGSKKPGNITIMNRIALLCNCSINELCDSDITLNIDKSMQLKTCSLTKEERLLVLQLVN